MGIFYKFAEMSIRKILSVLCMLAYIVVFVQTVFPHDHHCHLTLCTETGCEHGHDAHGMHHHHHANHVAFHIDGTCLISEDDDSCAPDLTIHPEYVPAVEQTALSCVEADFHEVFGIPLDETPPLSPHISSSGLRAPPVTA